MRLITLSGAGIAALLVLIVFGVVSYSVFMRYVLGTPITFSDELNGFIVVAMVALGAGEVLLRGEHFGVDLLTERAGPRIQWLIEVWGMVGVILVAAAVLYSAVLMVRFSYDFGIYSDGYLGIQMWIPQGFLLIGMIILILAALARIFTLVTVRRP
ncbi:TRAP-type C4-dicarboxylate transport system, small permease component [Roseibium album]|uniref:TRAP transporter small permease protein n=1 Tax=Roseibium album TaxID=311410 RepID=A0A0M6ZWQ1_9HYPH|nr:TRAP-type C4-dicarboxylate transport system, small permease component [Roseibium album]CTQ65964.1 TRAP-type C4-dicarboxylate transport system, small permease component [Roseibium album]CTQ70893.1 TRAP-type C4-dicarboxylate transport system, small permease component [Roseibium album]